MQFLVITRSREAVGPEMVLSLIERTQAWVAEQRASGKIMTGFPFTGYSSVEVLTLTDMDRSLANSKAQVERAVAMMAGQ